MITVVLIFLLLLFITLTSIAVWSHISFGNYTKKKANFSSIYGRGDTVKLIEILTELNAPLPDKNKIKVTNESSIEYEFFNECIFSINSYSSRRARELLKKLGYDNDHNFSPTLAICYNDDQSKIILLRSNTVARFLCPLHGLSFELGKNEIKYILNSGNKDSLEITLDQLSTMLKDLKDIRHIKQNSRAIPPENFYWRVEGDCSPSYYLSRTTGKAISGGLAFGTIGVLSSLAKSDDKDEKLLECKKRRVLNVYGVRACDGMRNDFDTNVDFMKENFSRYRLSDIYKNP